MRGGRNRDERYDEWMDDEVMERKTERERQRNVSLVRVSPARL